MLNKFRNKRGRKILAASARKNTNPVALKHFDEVKSIGIAYEADATGKNALVEEFVDWLRNQGKKVVLLGYMHVRKLPENIQRTLDSMYFCKDSLTWTGLVKKNAVQAFTHEEFDYLVNIDFQGRLALQCVSAWSQAKLRIGLYRAEYEFANDFMINNGSADPGAFIQQLKHYLTLK